MSYQSIGINTPVQLGTQQYKSIELNFTFTKPANITLGTLDYIVKAYNSSGSSKKLAQSNIFGIDLGLNASMTLNKSFELGRASLDWDDGNYMVVEIKQRVAPFLKWTSNSISLKKTPTYSLTSNVNEISCGTNAPVIFTLNTEAPTNLSSYNWTFGTDWTAVGSVNTNSVTLTSSSANPSMVKVTPIFDNQTQPSFTKKIILTPFSTNASITGKENICYTSGTTETYTLNYLPANCTVNWSSNNPSVASIASFNNQQATLNINTAGNFKLSASITNACGQKEDYAKYIYGNVSNGLPNPIIVGSEPDPNKIYNKYDDLIIYFEDQNGSTNFNPTNFEFQLDNPSDFTLIGVYGNVAVLNVKYSSPYLNLGFVTRMKNDCGWSEWKYQSFFLQGFDPYYPYYGYRVSTASNTYSAELNILIDEEDDKTPNKSLKHKKLNEDTFESYTIEIASLQGQTVFKKDKIKNNKITVPTAKWQKGVYYMKISNSKGEVKQKSLLIQ